MCLYLSDNSIYVIYTTTHMHTLFTLTCYTFWMLKGLFMQKSSYTHPPVDPNLYDFFLQNAKDIDPIDFNWIMGEIQFTTSHQDMIVVY